MSPVRSDENGDGRGKATGYSPWQRLVFMVGLVVAGEAVFGLRGVYFALLQEAKVPMAVTGTAVGLVSVVGYTPDIFVNWVGGWLLDRTPGVGGHQDFFWFLASFAAIGLVAGVLFDRFRPASEESVALE